MPATAPIAVVAKPTAGGSAGRLMTERPNTSPDAQIAASRKPAQSMGGGGVRLYLRQHEAGDENAGEPDRHVDDQNPMPGHVGGDETAHRRPDHRADERGYGQPRHCIHMVA